ncbi:general transcription factor II-I repeat domain-containing protein 2A [Trichonephila clavipes]|nr:general transcription factor II-I repeat domain-containing protein 2A [Trichonephila clavipes]
MVFGKKGVIPSKRVQGKKVFEVDSESDFDGDSSEEMVVQKTPKNKTPQGRNSQSMSAKKVSFELSSKKTPGKTPQKNNSFVGKKQPILVAKGMKGNKDVQKKKPLGEEMEEDDSELDIDDTDDDDEEEEDEDGIDEEDEDGIDEEDEDGIDDEEDEDGIDDEEDEDGIDDEEDEDDIDDEDEDDIDDDEEDEDDINDDEEEDEQKQIRKQKSNSKQKIPIKGADESKEPQKIKAKSKKNEEKLKSKGERDSVSLFIGNLPQDVTQDELRALSSDITDVFMPHPFRRFAFLRFASEEKADTNYKTLQGKELNGFRLNVDYQGAKTSSAKKQKVQDSKCSREFQTWWTEKCGMISKGNKVVCVLCSGIETYSQHFNEWNIKLQGPSKTVIVMMDLIRAFGAKLYAFRNDIITRNYKYFPNLKKNIKDLDAQEKQNETVIDEFISTIYSLN